MSWSTLESPRKGYPLSLIDGFRRTPEAEKRINEAIARAFHDDSGKLALAYLRSITIESINGPDSSDAELRHHEGMRHLFGIIEARIKAQGMKHG